MIKNLRFDQHFQRNDWNYQQEKGIKNYKREESFGNIKYSIQHDLHLFVNLSKQSKYLCYGESPQEIID